MGKEKGKLNSSNLLSSCWNIADLGYMSTVEKRNKERLDGESQTVNQTFEENLGLKVFISQELSDPCRIFNHPLTDLIFTCL